MNLLFSQNCPFPIPPACVSLLSLLYDCPQLSSICKASAERRDSLDDVLSALFVFQLATRSPFPLTPSLLCPEHSTSFLMASEGEKFPSTITLPASGTSFTLIGNGVTDMTIETILVKFSALAVYVEPAIANHLQAWKGKPTSELVAEGSSYFSDFVDAPVQKLVIVRIVKGIRGSAYAGGLESSIRDRLAYDDKYEDEEETSLEELVKYISSHNLPVSSSIYFHWSSPSVVQVTVSPDGLIPEQSGNRVVNENVAKFLLHWLIGERAVSESTALSTAEGVTVL